MLNANVCNKPTGDGKDTPSGVTPIDAGNPIRSSQPQSSRN